MPCKAMYVWLPSPPFPAFPPFPAGLIPATICQMKLPLTLSFLSSDPSLSQIPLSLICSSVACSVLPPLPSLIPISHPPFPPHLSSDSSGVLPASLLPTPPAPSSPSSDASGVPVDKRRPSGAAQKK